MMVPFPRDWARAGEKPQEAEESDPGPLQAVCLREGLSITEQAAQSRAWGRKPRPLPPTREKMVISL